MSQKKIYMLRQKPTNSRNDINERKWFSIVKEAFEKIANMKLWKCQIIELFRAFLEIQNLKRIFIKTQYEI